MILPGAYGSYAECTVTFTATRSTTAISFYGFGGPGSLRMDDVSLFKCFDSPPSPPSPPVPPPAPPAPPPSCPISTQSCEHVATNLLVSGGFDDCSLTDISCLSGSWGVDKGTSPGAGICGTAFRNYSICHTSPQCVSFNCADVYVGIKQTVLNLDVSSLYILRIWVSTGLKNEIRIMIDGVSISNMTGFDTGEYIYIYCLHQTVSVRPTKPTSPTPPQNKASMLIAR